MVINIELPDRWKTVNLGDVLSYIGNGLTNKQNKANDGYPVTRIETISDDCINAEKVGYVDILTNDKIEKYRLYYGDILVSHINSEPQLGRAVIYEGKPEFLLHGMNLLRMRADTKTLDPFFLTLIFKFYRNRGVFIALASRAVGQASINQSRMKSIMIPLPPLPEQRAIAHILQTIQEAKFTRQSEIALEHERKAALMDYLFSHGTKGESRKQTEIGEIPESWETVGLGKVAVFTKKPRDLRYSDYSEVPFVPMELIPIAKLLSQEFILKTNDELKSGTYFEPGDILLPKITPSFENGKQCIIKELPTPFGIATTEVIPIREIEGVSDISYLFYYLLLPNVRISLAGKMQGTTGRQRLSKDALVNLQIPLPPLPEQRAIAAVFQAIDEKTAALEKEVKHLNELFHAVLDELMTGQRSAMPLINVKFQVNSV